MSALKLINGDMAFDKWYIHFDKTKLGKIFEDLIRKEASDLVKQLITQESFVFIKKDKEDFSLNVMFETDHKNPIELSVPLSDVFNEYIEFNYSGSTNSNDVKNMMSYVNLLQFQIDCIKEIIESKESV